MVRTTCLRCINPAAIVCVDRSPAFIEELCRINIESPSDAVKIALNSAICYIGHEECFHRMDEEKKLAQIEEKNIDGEIIYCPICELPLKVIKSNRTVIWQCPAHGVLLHGIIKNGV